MLKPRSGRAAADLPPDDSILRQTILAFLALNEQPARWTFFRAASEPEQTPARRFSRPDIVLEVGGRIAYVEVRRQGGGPLAPARAAALALARCRGAACFVVRSLPDMERVLRALGVRLCPRGRLIDRRAGKDGDVRPA